MTAIKITAALRKQLKPLADLPDAMSLEVMRHFAKTQKCNISIFTDALTQIKAELVAKGEAASKALATAIQREKDASVRVQIQAATSVAEAMEFLPYVTERKKLIFLTPEGNFDTTLVPRKSAGRVKKDTPSGYLDVLSETEILGSMRTFVKTGIKAERFTPDVLAKLKGKNGEGNLKTNDKLVAVLVEFGEITPKDSEDSESEE